VYRSPGPVAGSQTIPWLRTLRGSTSSTMAPTSTGTPVAFTEVSIASRACVSVKASTAVELGVLRPDHHVRRGLFPRLHTRRESLRGDLLVARGLPMIADEASAVSRDTALDDRDGQVSRRFDRFGNARRQEAEREDDGEEEDGPRARGRVSSPSRAHHGSEQEAEKGEQHSGTADTRERQKPSPGGVDDSQAEPAPRKATEWPLSAQRLDGTPERGALQRPCR